MKNNPQQFNLQKTKLNINTRDYELSEQTIERLKQLEIFDLGSIEEQNLLINILKNS